jgi:two-component system cell cycle sensor histidine kinase/response regulator CckA
VSSSPLHDQAGEFEGELAMVTDITEQKRANEALRESEQRARAQFAKMPVPTFFWELAGDDLRLVNFNEAAEQTFARYGQDPLGKLASELDPHFPELLEASRQSLAEGAVVRLDVEWESREYGERRTYQVTIGPQPPNRVLVHAVDTTERTHLEHQLRHAQKMEAVGRLAGGVAHDFNNLLTVIGVRSTFLLEGLEETDPRREDVQEIHAAGRRAAALTRQLLAFSRKQIMRPSVISLNDVVQESQKMLSRLIGEDIEIETRLAPDLGRVMADSGQIDQVIVNLAVNARDAMPDGGRLLIETANVEVGNGDQAVDEFQVTRPGSYSLLKVSDTGTGMNEATRARIFEPFFTTKEAGKGTGLGLPTVYGIIKQSDGYIWVDSEPGRGASFRIYLPRVTSADRTEPRRGPMADMPRGMETVLIVEDDETVRAIAARTLRRQGYVVLEARDGDAAIALASSYPESIDLLLCDAIMPGMGGAEVVREMLAIRPGLTAVYMSGYTSDEVVRSGIVAETVAFIQKPFSPGELAASVRKALDSRSAESSRGG